MNNQSDRAVGVVGAGGYTGREVTSLLARHPSVRVAFATSSEEAGRPSPAPGVTLCHPEEAALAQAEVVFLCLPHGAAVEWTERALDAGARVVDLTADHRPGSGRERGALYGLADVTQADMAETALVANPGCYPTGALVSLMPLAEAGLLESGAPLIVNAASGVTGAGRTPRRDLLFAEVAGDFRAYAAGNTHRHLAEMRHGLPGFDVLFQPHLLPVPRGILETIVVRLAAGAAGDDVLAAWSGAYAGNPTVRVLRDRPPSLRDVVRTDTIALGVAEAAGIPGMATVFAAIDNLGKGAAGQAVQNMNRMLGMDALTGLRLRAWEAA